MKRIRIVKRTAIFVSIILALFMAAAFFERRLPNEPVFQGKTVTQWLTEIPYSQSRFVTDPQDEKIPPGAVEPLKAIRALGKKALPTLQRHMRPVGSPTYQFCEWWNQRFAWKIPAGIQRKFKPPPPIDLQLQFKSAYAFTRLDIETRKAALPWIAKFLQEGRRINGAYFSYLTVSMGTNVAPIIPPLLKNLPRLEKSPDGINWVLAVMEIVQSSGVSTAEAIALINPYLTSPHPEVAVKAATVLATLDPRRKEGLAIKFLPAIQSRLGNLRTKNIHEDFKLLGILGPHAKPALPILHDFLTRYIENEQNPKGPGNSLWDHIYYPEAIKACSQIDPQNARTRQLLGEIFTSNVSIPDTAWEALSHSGPEANKYLIPALEDWLKVVNRLQFGETRQDRLFVENLRKMDPDLGMVVPLLVQRWSEKKPFVQKNAGLMLDALGDDLEPALKKLKSTHPELQPAADEWLQKGAEKKHAGPTLTR